MTSANLIIYPSGTNFVAKDLWSQAILSKGSATEAISAAIQALPGSGGVIQLAAGDFVLERPLTLRSRQSLRGSGRATRIIAPPVGIGDQGAIVVVDADSTEIADLTLVGREGCVACGVVLSGCGDCRVTNILAKGFANSGIELRNHSFLCQINQCSAAGCGAANFRFSDLGKGGRGGDYLPNIVNGCVAYGGHVGFEVQSTLVLNLVGCMVHQSGSHGFHLHHQSNSVLLSGCRTFQVGGSAVMVDDSNELNISSSIFCWTREHGIVLRKVSWGTINGCNVIDAGVRAPDGGMRDAIHLRGGSEGIQITGNALFSWGDQVPMAHGVFEDASCRNNSARANNLNFFRTDGFVMKGAGSQAGENIAIADPVYRGNPSKPFPDFTREATERFIREQ